MIFGRTGEQCSITGRYRCFGNYEVQVSIKEGESFPQAGDALNVFWILSGKAEDEQSNNMMSRLKDKYHS